MIEDDKRLFLELMGEECICKGPKRARMSHCRTCYFSLPERQRRALYRRIGSGYAEAYADSLLTLKAKGRIPVDQIREAAGRKELEE